MIRCTSALFPYPTNGKASMASGESFAWALRLPRDSMGEFPDVLR